MSSKDTSETRTMHSKSANKEYVIGKEANEIIQKLFDSLLQKYRKGFEESMKGSEFSVSES